MLGKTESSLSVLLLILNFLPLANELLLLSLLIHGIVEIFHQHPEIRAMPTLSLGFLLCCSQNQFILPNLPATVIETETLPFLQMQEVVWTPSFVCLLLLYLLSRKPWVSSVGFCFVLFSCGSISWTCLFYCTSFSQSCQFSVSSPMAWISATAS